MIRGKLALIPAMSRIRPACPPMNTKPSWMRIGNRTSSGTDTQAPPPPAAIAQATPNRTAAPPRTMTAIRTMSKRCARPRDVARHHDARDADGDVRHGQPADPYASRNIALATMPSSAAIAPNRKRLRRQPVDGAARPGGRPVLTRASRPSRAASARANHRDERA